MSFLVVANFKSHKTVGDVESWIKDVAPSAKTAKDLEIIVAPAFPHLSLVHSFNSSLTLASQDVSPFPPGSYTGAVSAVMLKDLGVSYAIVGHSERRHYFHETSSEVGNKVKELLDQNITPIVCMAESDIVSQFGDLTEGQIKHCVFCFEPPSQIGGTDTASLDEIKRVIGLIQQTFGIDSVMYGGSVNYGNVASLVKLNLSGVLVAGGSLESADFIKLIEQLKHV